MDHRTPLQLVPGSWDDLVARAALKAAEWLHDRLNALHRFLARPEPTLAAAPLPDDPWRRLADPGRGKRGNRAHREADGRSGRDPS